MSGWFPLCDEGLEAEYLGSCVLGDSVCARVHVLVDVFHGMCVGGGLE